MTVPDWDARMTATDRLELQSWIRNRDADAFKQLTLRYSGLVYRTCLRITSNPGDAEDLTQECFETLAAQAKPPRAPLGAWLHRVATNRALNQVKVRGRRAVRERAYAAHNPQTTQITWSDVDGLVDDAIGELPDELRAMVIAHFLESESYTSIALRIGTTRQTAANRVQKGVLLIRRSLKKRGVVISAPALAALFAAESAGAAQVPASVIAVLGKLAVAGVTNPACAAGTANLTGAYSGSANVLGGITAMKSSFVGAGLVVAVVAVSAATAMQFQAQHAELLELRQSNSELAVRAGEVDALQSQLETAREESAHLSEKLDQTQPTAGGNIRLSGSGTNNVPTAQVDAITSQVVQVDHAILGKTEHGDALVTSKAELSGLFFADQAVNEAQILRTANERYAALFGMLQLPGDVRGHVRSALAAHVRELVISGAISFTDLYDGVIDTQQLRETLGTLLTPDEMATWETFENDVPYFQSQQKYATEMTQAIPGLTVDNRGLAAAVLAEEQLFGKEMVDENAESSRVERLTQEFQALERARMRIAQAYIDAEQFALVNDYVQQQQALIQAQLEQGEGSGLFLNFATEEPLSLTWGSL